MSCGDILSIVLSALGVMVAPLISYIIYRAEKKRLFVQYYDRIVFDNKFCEILAIFADKSDNKQQLWLNYIADSKREVLLENFLSFLNMIFYQYRVSLLLRKGFDDPIIQPIISDKIILGLIKIKNKEYGGRYKYLCARIDSIAGRQK